MFINKELFKSMLWTAHGMKTLPFKQDMSWVANASGWVPALPNLSDLLHRPSLDQLFSIISSFQRLQFDESFSVQRYVLRHPLKPSPMSGEEKVHLNMSCDGLRLFQPVDIYPKNIGASDGLIYALRQLQKIEGCGLSDHKRFGSYSLLHVDVAVFWQLLRMFYCYSGLAPFRHDLILCLGFWHPYMYAHVAIWNEFRHTFLAEAFFLLFPNQKLMRRPKLFHSTVFFTWLRLAYTDLQPILSQALVSIQKDMFAFELQHTRNIRDGKVRGKKFNQFRAHWLHLLNLQTLFEFCIPVVQDYGCLLKTNDFPLFKASFHKLLLLFLLCRSRGSLDYQRTMLVFAILLQYWEAHNLPVCQLLSQNHTSFSEESGEIALSVLARTTPASCRADIEQVQHHWQMVRLNFEFHASSNSEPPAKKRRLLSKFFVIDCDCF
jgi:hypothetical protein